MTEARPDIHESIAHEQPIQTSSDRSFGIVMGVFFAIVGLWPVLFGGTPRWWSIGIAAAFTVLALVLPRVLAPLNRLWFRFGLFLNRIVSPIILGLMFYGVFTPIGLLLRLFGKDLLRLKLDKSTESYWIDRDPPGPAPETIKQQF